MLAYITIFFWWASNVMDTIIRPLWLSTNIFLNMSFTTRTIIDGLRYHIENCEIIDMYYKKTSSGVLILILHRDNFVYNKYIRPSCSTYQLQPYVLNWLSIWSLGSKKLHQTWQAYNIIILILQLKHKYIKFPSKTWNINTLLFNYSEDSILENIKPVLRLTFCRPHIWTLMCYKMYFI